MYGARGERIPPARPGGCAALFVFAAFGGFGAAFLVYIFKAFLFVAHVFISLPGIIFYKAGAFKEHVYFLDSLRIRKRSDSPDNSPFRSGLIRFKQRDYAFLILRNAGK